MALTTLAQSVTFSTIEFIDNESAWKTDHNTTIDDDLRLLLLLVVFFFLFTLAVAFFTRCAFFEPSSFHISKTAATTRAVRLAIFTRDSVNFVVV